MFLPFRDYYYYYYYYALAMLMIKYKKKYKRAKYYCKITFNILR